MRSGLAALVIAVALLGVAVQANAVEVVDQTGATVRIDEPVERIVSVYGIGTYFLYALGVADRMVGAAYVGVKSLGQASETMLRFEPRLEDLLLLSDPNVEEVLHRNPQLVLADGSRHEVLAGQLADLEIPTIQYLVESSDELEVALRLTGQALGGEAAARAEALLGEFDRVAETIDRDLAGLDETERARVLFVGTSPLCVASGAMFQTELVELAGGTSVSEGLIGYWNDVNLEQILLWNPDVIVIAPYGAVQPADLLEDPDWASLEAVRSDRVVRMPRLIAPMDTPLPESLLGIVWMAEILYPDLVTLDLREEATSFYTDFYGFALTEDELDLLAGR
jgi:iron complex transport system substrate-binding protein